MASEHWRRQIGAELLQLEQEEQRFLFAADGRRVEIIGKIQCDFNINGLVVPYTALIVPNLTQKLIIGQDMLKHTKANIDYATNTVSFYDDMIRLNVLNSFHEAKNIVRVARTCRIPANSEAIIQGFSSNNDFRSRHVTECYMMEAIPTQMSKPYLLARTITAPHGSITRL